MIIISVPRPGFSYNASRGQKIVHLFVQILSGKFFFFSFEKMVKTRLSTKKPPRSLPIENKKLRSENAVVQNESKNSKNIDRCKNWIQQQKKEKLKFQLEELNSDDSDEERQMRLDSVSEKVDKNTVIAVYFGCEWQRCHQMFESNVELQQHVVGHLNAAEMDDVDTLKCDWDLCDFECVHREILHRHVGFHVYMTKLKTIGEQLLQKKVLPPCINDSRRRNFVPNTDSKYVCNWKDCNYTFEMPQEYFDHARSHCIHEIEINKQGHRNQTVQCKWVSCKKTFNKRLKMTDHMRTHSGEKFVACANCGSTFNSYVKFYDHYRRQAITNNYKCGECFQSFNTDELLSNHMYGHINRHKCTMCDMTCPSPAALTQHFRYRHLKLRPFKCQKCEYGAVTKYDLDKHVTRMHSDDLISYFCEEFECDYTCFSVQNLRKHMTNVHGDGPKIYCCHCCNQRYKNGCSLSKHLIRNHGFQLPSGHRRFTYHMDIDGIYRVQTTRTESLEVSEQIIAQSARNSSKKQNPTYELSEFAETSAGLVISVIETSPKKVPPMPKIDTENMVQPLDELSQQTSVGNEIETIDSNRFMESLNLKQLTPNKRTSAALRTDDNDDDDDDDDNNRNTIILHSAALKDIDEFSVIKKYARKKRTPKTTRMTTLTIQDVDEDGNILHSETKDIMESDIDSLTH